MTEIPLILRLKKQMHKDVARAQDIIIKELYNMFDKAVLHGGTAIWRCYNGNRFSEDVDVYIQKDEKRINALFENLKKQGFIIKKKKIGEKSLFSRLELNRTFVRFEILFKKPIPKGSLKEYEKTDGNFITVYTLTPEELIKEKIEAYLKRLKIRDIYDVFFLLRYVKDKGKVSKELKKLTKEFKKPIDEKELMILIIEGLVPDINKILDYIKRSI
ncbi:nucleotidyl transferase AbiEii/AbiGii toxin family protein [Candidatus Woesearchaeota archaeon]|nr:nucleotidyl transferase AbiEii/AbiGii toxin family protein [Candidatus Woesearchaeota archaeon]